MPTNVSAMELISSPDTPKSQILICPCELTSMLEGLTSEGWQGKSAQAHGWQPEGIIVVRRAHKLTSVDDTVHVVQVRQA